MASFKNRKTRAGGHKRTGASRAKTKRQTRKEADSHS